MKIIHPGFWLVLLLAGCGGGGGGGSSAPVVVPPSSAYTDTVVYSSAPTASLQTPNEIVAVTRHQLAIGAATLNYTATAGHLTALQLGNGAPQASFFYVAYTVDGAAPATRPVTFFYNGGPGSATVWLHLGSFGPRRLVSGMPATNAPTPYPLVDNAQSLLDASDLVFVDAVGAGLSEAIAPNTNSTFWGVDADAAVFRDFVMSYVARNNRAASPKFLFGESYGTTRSAVLANLLESAGVTLSGVVLQSSVLDYNNNCGLFTVINRSCAGYLPTYGATGAWFNRVNPVVAPGALPGFITQLRDLAANRYDPAVRTFLTSHIVPVELIPELVDKTGFPAAGWQARFNLDPEFFRINFTPGTLLGRYDARVTAVNNSVPGREDDPSDSLISPSFAFRITEYLTELQYTNPTSYVLLSNAINTWNFSHDGRAAPDVVPDLAAALAHNPRLKVFSMSGYNDLATPFFTTERDLARLGVNPNIQQTFYSGGHMTYLDDAARVQQKADLAQFYRSALVP
jgi:carboxypeptidase C (cathepsin A)